MTDVASLHAHGQRDSIPGGGVSLGAILAFLVLVAALVFFLMGRMDVVIAVMFGALALSILLSPFPIRWPGQAS